MHPQNDAGQAPLAHADRTKLLWSLGLSLFWVIFLWGFFDRDVYALGVNAFLYLATIVGLFLWAMQREGVSLRKNAHWIAPIFLVTLSYALYDNPFLKTVSILALPATFALFYNEAFLSAQGRVHWNGKTVEALVWRALSIVTHVRKAGDLLGRLLARARKNPSTAKRVAAGIALFLLIATAVVIPLLSSADAQFAATMGFVNEWIKKLFSTSLFGRIVVFFLLSVGTIAALLAWARPSSHAASETETKQVDPIIAGIVLGGVLALYALFLWIQLGHMWVGKLPIEFSETERLVKDGFWQLLCLTFINILFAFTTYRKTVPAVQRLLAAFSVASFLLLASAGHRMALYVTYYGLSYEKFFASYAVAFCAVLLLWLVSRLFVRARADVVRFPAMLFLWMYAVLTVMPVEQIILRSNVALSHREGSQIRLFELTMLSPDVLDLVRKYQSEGVLEEKNPFYSREAAASMEDGAYSKPNFDWGPWITDRADRVAKKAWYERNLMNLLTK
jgi:multisubunit Na+/H+ antiporter MnhC subunit